MKRFFNNPDKLSFKDVLAIAFSAVFLIIVFQATKSKDALDVLKVLANLIAIILGGYFSTEVATAFFQSKYPNPYQQYYNGYYDNYYPTVPPQTITENQTESVSQPEINSIEKPAI